MVTNGLEETAAISFRVKVLKIIYHNLTLSTDTLYVGKQYYKQTGFEVN
jgi:hypothetical protein